MSNAEIRNKRFRLFFIFISLFSLVILFRYALVMLAPSRPSVRSEIVLPEAARGPILDSKGNLLAVQTQLYSVSLWRPELENPEETARILAETLSMDEEELSRLLGSPEGSNFVWIKRQITPSFVKSSIQEICEDCRRGFG